MSAETYGVAAGARGASLPDMGDATTMRRRLPMGSARTVGWSSGPDSPRSPMSLPRRMLTQTTIGLVEPGWPAFWGIVLQDTVAWTFVLLMLTDLGAAYFNNGTDPCLGEGRGTPVCESVMSKLSHTSMVFGTISAFLCFLSGPLTGCMADIMGTKAVLVTSLCIRMTQFMAFFGLAYGKMSIYAYFVAQELASLVYSGLAFNLWVIENTPPDSRVTTIARLTAVLSLEGAIVPIVIIWAPKHIAPFVVMCLGVGSVLCAIFGLPTREISPAVQLAVKSKGLLAVTRKQLGEAWEFLTADGNRTMILVTIVGQTVAVGLGGIWYLYLKVRFGMGMHDLARYAALSSVFFVVVQVVIVPALQPILGLKSMISTGMSFGLAAECMYLILPNESWLWVCILLSALAGMNGPAVCAMVANMATADTGGEGGNSALAAANSVNAVAFLIAPILFQGVFSHFLKPGNVFFESAWPGAPYALGIVGTIIALVLLQMVPDETFAKASAKEPPSDDMDQDENSRLTS